MFLDQILQYKQAELRERKKAQPAAALERQLANVPPVRPFRESCLSGPGGIRLIAEMKKASPSKGLLCPDFRPDVLAVSYERAGAACISVLTEERFFQGSLDILRLVKAQTGRTPLLRKDFIIDPYQLLEARLAGADAVLLIAAALPPQNLRDLIREARNLNLDRLVEVHNRTELEIALEAGADMIGINNRDLYTFAVNLNTTFELTPLIPKGIVRVAESGIRNRGEIIQLGEAGVDAVLIGESLVTAADPEAKIAALLGVVS